ncbi:MAG: toll/interleukin-1 receptor domain-containing protein [Pseudomonadota bacterium]
MSEQIFISYRRDDARDEATHIETALSKAFGADNVFKDTGIQPGVDWPERLQTALASAVCVVVVIGPKWLEVGLDKWGRRRIDQEADWVRRELIAALGDSHKLTLPVLVRGALLPPAHALPDAISALSSRQSISLRPEHLRADIGELIAQISSRVAPSKDEAEPNATAQIDSGASSPDMAKRAPRTRVFIGSAGDDLANARNSLIDGLGADGRYEVVAADWIAMTARGISEAIATCAHVVVLAGYRFCAYADGNISPIEAEYDMALALKTPVWVLMQAEFERPLETVTESGEDWAKQVTLRAKLAAHDVCDYFQERQELDPVLAHR